MREAIQHSRSSVSGSGRGGALEKQVAHVGAVKEAHSCAPLGGAQQARALLRPPNNVGLSRRPLHYPLLLLLERGPLAGGRLRSRSGLVLPLRAARAPALRRGVWLLALAGAPAPVPRRRGASVSRPRPALSPALGGAAGPPLRLRAASVAPPGPALAPARAPAPGASGRRGPPHRGGAAGRPARRRSLVVPARRARVAPREAARPLAAPASAPGGRARAPGSPVALRVRAAPLAPSS
mmetsp:Transcript_24331/g.57453  ORF Transcript_24331/g.57453 Transcript_24331/m.57453 type:complete len:238 (-) Transcript_24331:336-1049(-)